MVKIVNIFKAAGLWVGTIFLLYGTQSVDKTVAQAYQGYGMQYSKGYGALAPTRSPETGSRSLSQPGGFDPLVTEFPRKGFGSPQGGHSVSQALRTEFPTGGFGN